MALRYCVGIDLGTSNSALAYADLNARDPGAAVSVFEVPQLVGPGDLAPRPLLPSHLYLPGPHELPERALTLRAAAEAGLPRPALLEEPQAAFYDFTRVHRGALAQELAGVRLVLVCDIGGGTTDFTLIAVEGSGEEPVLRRLAVGDHLLLGGDNMDIALARRAEADLRVKLGAGQWGALVQACRTAKERLLAADAPDRAAVTVPGQGSRLVGGALTAHLAREAAREQILEGFVPRVTRGDLPSRGARVAGLSELGLPYASDPAITR